MAPKRKNAEDAESRTKGTGKKRKRQDTVESTSKNKEQKIEWPEYFNDLFKIFKALNTVLAFCSSRKNLATTFPVIRSSVEGLLHRPLELSKVAELKALLPELIRFAYIPENQHRINASPQSSKGKGRERSPDYSLNPRDAGAGALEEDEHVLVLEFAEVNSKGKYKKESPSESPFTVAPSLTPTAMKKLVEARNDRFSEAVNELLAATPQGESAVEILQAAARDHIPIEPVQKLLANDTKEDPTLNQPVPDSNSRPSIEEILREITGRQSDDYEKEDINEYVGLEWYKGQVSYRRSFEAHPGRLGILQTPLSPTIGNALRAARSITALYSHQAQAINALGESRNVVVSTKTASGKSVIYQVPFLRFLEEDKRSTAIFVYPTKALAQDQRAALEELLHSCDGLEGVHVATYDGDTPQEQRRWIRENASVIFTNFDMLHASILPHEDLWRSFLKSLKIMAVDELHYYTGLLGTHVAMIMRRFRRVCAAVGNRRCAFISCSATINNPERHANDIFGITDIEVVTDDGSPAGQKHFLVWDPAPIDPQNPSLGHESAMNEAIRLMCYLMKRGIRVILFCKIRKICELAMKTIRTHLSSEGRTDVLDRVMAYRGGYSPQDRRRIEREAFSGNLLGIIATTALELGIDIGVLDAVLMLGFPRGDLASFRQQAGRAGRRSRDSLVVLVADGSPVDRHYVNHPKGLFDNPTADLLIDLESKVILEAHLQCAAHEMPLSVDDEKYFGPLLKEVCDASLAKDKEGWWHPHPRYLPYPAKHVSIRGIQEETYAVVDVTRVEAGGEPKILEEVEDSRALFETYEGAVFLYQGQTFLVKEVSHDARMAKVVRTDVSWVTQPRDFTDVDAKRTYRIREIKESPQRAFYGSVDVKTTVFGYFKVRGGKILDAVDLDTPPFERETTGTWVDIPKGIVQLMRSKGITPAEGVHSACHAVLKRFSMAIDLATECKVGKKEYMINQTSRKRPARLIFYDRVGKGGGVAARAFDILSSMIHEALSSVQNCLCDDGCVNCVDDPNCKESNEVSSKLGALVILRGILGLPSGIEDLPDVDDNEVPDTIVEAEEVRTVEGIEVEQPYSS